jgi:hypothetical protein
MNDRRRVCLIATLRYHDPKTSRLPYAGQDTPTFSHLQAWKQHSGHVLGLESSSTALPCFTQHSLCLPEPHGHHLSSLCLTLDPLASQHSHPSPLCVTLDPLASQHSHLSPLRVHLRLSSLPLVTHNYLDSWLSLFISPYTPPNHRAPIGSSLIAIRPIEQVSPTVCGVFYMFLCMFSLCPTLPLHVWAWAAPSLCHGHCR